MMLRTQTLSLALLLCLSGFSQRQSSADKILVENLKAHIGVLADDALLEQSVRTKRETVVQDYIIKAFVKGGLEPKGDKAGFLQSFPIDESKFYQQKSYLLINEDSIPMSGWFPFLRSPETVFKVKCSIALKEIGVPWFLDLKDDMQTALSNAQFDLHTYISEKATAYSKKGASAIFAYNSDLTIAGLGYDVRAKGETFAIPVIFVSSDHRNGQVAKNF